MAGLPTLARQDIGGNALVWLQPGCRMTRSLVGERHYRRLVMGPCLCQTPLFQQSKHMRLKLDELHWKVCSILTRQNNPWKVLPGNWGLF
jgi:hypothetical protein